MAEHTQKFPLGAWVTGTTTDGNPIKSGYVSEFDTEDGQHYVRGVIVDLSGEREVNEGWAEAEELSEGKPPEWLVVPGPGHAFVYDWMDDDVANVSLHAEPQDIVAAYFEDATEDERASLQLKLMEAVVDPGERIELVPGGGSVRFCVVNG